jgi:UDP-3-O-[3-hydroxymyristoyl] N-acetylglucosamine deacetylase
MTSVKRTTSRRQQTIARPASVEGIGYITGKRVRLRFVPAPVSSGVVFVRTDLGPDAVIAAEAHNVVGTNRRTTLGKPPISVGLVEHVLAALAGLRIDNCRIELDAPEPPGMDGSAQDFVHALRSAGTVLQDGHKSVWSATESILVRAGDATLSLHPADCCELRVSYLLDYGPQSPIVPQIYTATITPETFMNDIAPSRTFLLEEEAQMLLAQGLGSNSTLSDLLVFGPKGPMNNVLRFGNEPARHKVLDILGDLSLLGHDLCGHVVAYRSGHPLNVEMCRTLLGHVQASAPQRRRAA